MDNIAYAENQKIDRKSSSGEIIIGLILVIIGILNIILGIVAVISAAIPDETVKPITPGINIGIIFLGSIMFTVGSLWVASGIGLLIKRSWAYNMAIYIAPAIVAINLAGVLNIWGFTVNIGWAAISTVTGIASIWYLSKKELASFFIISVVEHVVIIMIFAILIYSKPVDIAEPSDAVVVSIEEIKEPEKKEEKIIIKKEPIVKKITPKPSKQEEPEKLPTLPKIDIQNLNTASPGAKVESAVPQLPKSYAQVMDRGSDTILRTPGKEGPDKKYIDDLPNLDDKPAIYSSTKPSVGPAPPTTQTKPSSDFKAGNIGTRDVKGSNSPHVDGSVGPSSDVARPGFVGDITGEVVGRKVIFWPKQLEEYKGTQGGSTTIKFWVDPPGTVIRAEVSKKSVSSDLDRIAREYVLQIRFAELPKRFEQKNQWGEIIIRFELTRSSG